MAFNIGELQGTLSLDDGPFDSAIESVTGKIKDFAAKGGAAAAAAGAAIGVGLSLAIAAAFTADNVKTQIEAALGATPAQAAKFGQAAGKLFASNYGDSMEEAGQAVTSVVKNMAGLGDVSEDVLVGISAQVINVGKTFDQDFNAVTRSAGQLMKTGLAKNATEAMDIITAGFQSPVNAADDLLDTLDEYSTIFRSLGLDGKDALGILSQGLKSGARDADTVADSMKELLLRIQAGDSKQAITSLGLNFQAAAASIAKGGEAAKATTDLIIDQLNKVTDPAQRSALAVGLFGTKAEDMQKAISGIDVDKAATQFEQAYGKIQGSAEQLDKTVGGSLQAGFESVTRAAQGLVASLGDNVAPLITAAAGAFSFLFDILKGALDFIFDLPTPLYAIGAAVAIWASWGSIAAGATALAGAVQAIALSTKALVLSLPLVGVLVTAAAVALSFLTDTSDDAADKTANQKVALEDLRSTLDQTTGAITAATIATIKKKAVDSGMADTLKAAGISLDLYARAATGNVDAQEQLAAAVKNASSAAASSEGPFSKLSGVLAQAHISQEELNAAIASGDWENLRARVQGATSGTAAGGVAMQQFGEAIAAVSNPAASLNDVMRVTGDTANDLATAQSDVAATTGGTADAASNAYDKLLALATVGGYSAEQIAALGKEAGLTAPQIEAIQQSTEGATEAATPLADALSSGASAASEMDTAIQLLQLALDTLAGNEIDAAQATRAHEAVLRSVGQSTRDLAQANIDAAQAQKDADNVAAHLGQTLDGQAVSATNLAVTQEDVDAATRAAADASDHAKDAADKQSDALDQLADSAEGMTQRSFDAAGGMGNYEAAVAAATQTMVSQRDQFIASARAAGVGEDAAKELADAQGLIPGNVRTAYDAIRVQEAKDAAGGVTQAVNNVPNSKTVSINAETGQAERNVGNFLSQLRQVGDKTVTITQRVVGSGNLVAYQGGHVGALVRAFEGAQGFSDGGLVPGTPPANPTVDNVMATAMGRPIKLRSREFIEPEESVDYYGLPMMEAIRKRTFPKMQGYAAGGQAGSSSSAGTGGGVNVSVFIGDREITDIVQVVVADGLNQTARELSSI